ncbi:D-alanyl-D-alanine carboxypeptidase family protein [Staphylospora marina]|uniref:D-alanyl-D-alanine carboxypeptidase family protein n=1 Tax=Staphylospora marina TaxID=2490858 RepID=UPI000F5BE566|nr:D-alanyl-D-alanine carboxypeptidase family protein [Staphylospora marina]
MRKKFHALLIAVCLLIPFISGARPVWAASEQDLAPDSQSAVLMDAGSGTVIFAKNEHKPLPPASMTKIMTMLLVMEAIDQGKISMDDQVRVSEHAASMGGTQLFLEPGESMTVRDLLKGVSIASANDASVALAEFLGGTEENFARMMNERARELGLKQTHFVNASGLPAENHVSSAMDMAIMARELLKHPQITKFTGIYEDYLRKNTAKPFWLVNTNKLVKFYPGVDGLKTGFTQEAKYCLTATAKRGNMRLIAVVMGVPDVKKRNRQVMGMLDYAFNHYTSHLLYKKGDLIAVRKIDKGDPDKVAIRANHPLSLLVRKGESPSEYTKRFIWEDIRIPVKKGDRVGTLRFEKDGKVVSELELVSSVNVKEASLWSSVRRSLREFLFQPGDAEAKE